MPPQAYFIDASLLVLFVAGRVDKDIIAKHRRLEAYSVEDYELLWSMVAPVRRLLVTPNTLTEASNLLAQHGEPERSLLLEGLRMLIEESEEVVVASAVAASNAQFRRLGLTDAALLEVVTPDTPLLTVDLDLYLAAASSPDSVVNFEHVRGL